MLIKYVDDIICIIRHSDQEMILNEINLQYDNINLLLKLSQTNSDSENEQQII